MDELRIRLAESDDVTALSDLIQRTVRLSNAPDYGTDLAERIAANFGPDQVAQRLAGRDVFVGLRGDKIVGTIGLGAGKLRSLFVEPGLQQAGIGARLVAHLEAHARALGVVELQLSSSLTARGFYERLGYRTIRFEERDDGSTYLMSKTL
jgi:putative acetyltransferase